MVVEYPHIFPMGAEYPKMTPIVAEYPRGYSAGIEPKDIIIPLGPKPLEARGEAASFRYKKNL